MIIMFDLATVSAVNYRGVSALPDVIYRSGGRSTAIGDGCGKRNEPARFKASEIATGDERAGGHRLR